MKNQEVIREILDYYAGQKDAASQENLVAMLREIQETEGFITEEVKNQIQERFGIKETFLACILKMYPSLKQADYRHEIVLCTGERCGNKNSMALLERLKQELKPSKEGISADGTIRLTTRNCLKHCKTSPNMLLDGTLYTQLDENKLRSILRKIEHRS